MDLQSDLLCWATVGAAASATVTTTTTTTVSSGQIEVSPGQQASETVQANKIQTEKR